jgi:hypothetical protein
MSGKTSRVIRAAVGKYTDQQGQERTSWRTIGRVIQSDRGASIKLDTIPVGWDGWAILAVPDEQGTAGQNGRQRPPQARQQAPRAEDYMEQGGADADPF